MSSVDNLKLTDTATPDRPIAARQESWLASLARRVPARLWAPLLVARMRC
jgi:hypothetical protein